MTATQAQAIVEQRCVAVPLGEPDQRAVHVGAGRDRASTRRSRSRARRRDRAAGRRLEGDAARQRDRDDRGRARDARRLDRVGREVGSAPMLEIDGRPASASSPASRRSWRRDRRRVPRASSRSRTGSSTAAGAASRTGSRGATATSASARRTRRATRTRASCALYPGGESETELLFPYGYCHFKSKAGELWANHFATLVEGGEHLQELGRLTLWEGAQPISFRRRKPLAG